MKKTPYIYMVCLLIIGFLPMMSSCNNEDDVLEIFTGKSWKLSKISAEGTNIQFNYWPNDNAAGDAYQSSMKLLKSQSNFTLTFTGGQIGEKISGTFSGKGVQCSFDGQWQADGNNQQLNMSINSSAGSESDPLAKAFINGLKNVIRYEGDAKNLFIYFKEGQTTKYMGFTPQ